MDPADEATRLDVAVATLRRRYGPAALRRGGDPLPGSAWAAGLPVVDGLAGGGLPGGRLTLLAGEGRGATGRLTLLQSLAAAASRAGGVVYVDLAGTLDPGFLADLGADLGACLVVRPPGGAAGPGLAMARALVRAGVRWVGVAMGRRRVDAALLEHPLTALLGAAEATRTVVCVSSPAPPPRPLAYASSLTVACTAAGWQEAHGDIVGLRVALRVTKSRVGAPGGEATVLLRYPRPHLEAGPVGLPAVVAAAPAPPEPEREAAVGAAAVAASVLARRVRRPATPLAG